MSNRVGRNPFQETSKTKPIAQSPFDAQTTANQDEPIIGEMIDLSEDESMSSVPAGLITKLLVEIPAEAYVLSLKARLFARNFLR
jgi:hypothetical protein